MITITTKNDLRTYLGNCRGDLADRLDEATEFLAARDDRPAYGTNWAEWLTDELHAELTDHIATTYEVAS